MVENGFIVELAKRVLCDGTWESGLWDWKSEYVEFRDLDQAKEFFRKQKRNFPNKYQLVRIFECEFEYIGRSRTGTTFGDELMEYVMENGKKVVWEM